MQGLYDLKTERFVHFSHSAFVRNDLRLAAGVLKITWVVRLGKIGNLTTDEKNEQEQN